MKQTITEQMFIDSFTDCNRQENFSRSGRKAIFEYFSELEDSCDMEIELDPIGICCEYSEYSSATEVWNEYFPKGVIQDEENALAWLEHNTQVISHDEGIIIQSF